MSTGREKYFLFFLSRLYSCQVLVSSLNSFARPICFCDSTHFNLFEKIVNTKTKTEEILIKRMLTQELITNSLGSCVFWKWCREVFYLQSRIFIIWSIAWFAFIDHWMNFCIFSFIVPHNTTRRILMITHRHCSIFLT